MPTFTSENFTLEVTKQEKKHGVKTAILHITDRFAGPRHRLERKGFSAFSRQLEKYLAKRPHLHFGHGRNIAQKLVYFPPSLRAWAAYMPGAFATYPVHNPDVKHLPTGKKIDYMTRNLFRHSVDAIGLRSRAYAMAWYIVTTLGNKQGVRWLSIASGTGQQTFDAAKLLKHHPWLYLTDIDDDAMKFAAMIGESQGVQKTHLHIDKLDVTDEVAFVAYLKKVQPDVIDMMGLMEYLEDERAVRLINVIIRHAPAGCLFVFTNMLPTHPELNLHKRGLGWPGVIVRSTNESLKLLAQAGVKDEAITVLLPDDKVYAVFCINVT